MTTTKVKVSKRAEAYIKAHNLNPDDVFEMGISSFARDHSLGDPARGLHASTKRGDAHITYSPTFITKGDTNVSVLSNIKLALRVVFAPQTDGERLIQLGIWIGVFLTAGTIFGVVWLMRAS